MMMLSGTVRKRKWYQRHSHQNLNEEVLNSVTASKLANDNTVNYSAGIMPRIFLLQDYFQEKTNEGIGNASLDIITHNNIPEWLELPPNGITEISGEAGTGKTQLGLSLCVSCAFRSYSHNTNTIRHVHTSTLKTQDNNDRDYILACPKTQNLHQHKYRNTLNNRKLSKNNVHSPYNHSSRDTSPLAEQSKFLSIDQRESDYYKSMYISMGGEGTSPSQIAHRLQQMAQCLSSRTTTDESSPLNVRAVLQRIWTRYIPNIDTFHDLIFTELPQLLLQFETLGIQRCKDRFGLLVFDSIAGLYRTKEDSGNDDKREKVEPSVVGDDKVSDSIYYAQRSQDLFTIAAQLKYISDRFGVGIVVLNQVTATNPISIGIGGGELMVVPALGLTWSNCVNHRYILSRTEDSSKGEERDNNRSNSTKFVRKIRVYCSPRYGTIMEAKFQITGCGVVLIR